MTLVLTLISDNDRHLYQSHWSRFACDEMFLDDPRLDQVLNNQNLNSDLILRCWKCETIGDLVHQIPHVLDQLNAHLFAIRRRNVQTDCENHPGP